VDCLFFDFENLLRLFQQWGKCKNYRNGCYSCYKASCQVLNYKIVEKKSYNNLYITWSKTAFLLFDSVRKHTCVQLFLPIAI